MAKAKMKNKSEHYISIDLDQRYMSTYHFVGYNELSNVANMLWGKGWRSSGFAKTNRLVQRFC